MHELVLLWFLKFSAPTRSSRAQNKCRWPVPPRLYRDVFSTSGLFVDHCLAWECKADFFCCRYSPQIVGYARSLHFVRVLVFTRSEFIHRGPGCISTSLLVDACSCLFIFSAVAPARRSRARRGGIYLSLHIGAIGWPRYFNLRVRPVCLVCGFYDPNIIELCSADLALVLGFPGMSKKKTNT